MIVSRTTKNWINHRISRLDSKENAAALDIIETLGCDSLQEEMKREWKGVLDGEKLREEERKKWDSGGGGNAGRDFGGDVEFGGDNNDMD